VTSNPGKITVLKAGGEWEIVATNDLEDICFATPAIAGNNLYVRTRSTLYAFGSE
jgi:outer membrane protein assembly factor BamB